MGAAVQLGRSGGPGWSYFRLLTIPEVSLGPSLARRGRRPRRAKTNTCLRPRSAASSRSKIVVGRRLRAESICLLASSFKERPEKILCSTTGGRPKWSQRPARGREAVDAGSRMAGRGAGHYPERKLTHWVGGRPRRRTVLSKPPRLALAPKPRCIPARGCRARNPGALVCHGGGIRDFPRRARDRLSHAPLPPARDTRGNDKGSCAGADG